MTRVEVVEPRRVEIPRMGSVEWCLARALHEMVREVSAFATANSWCGRIELDILCLLNGEPFDDSPYEPGLDGHVRWEFVEAMREIALTLGGWPVHPIDAEGAAMDDYPYVRVRRVGR